MAAGSSPDVDDAEEAMLSVAFHAVDENWMSDWLGPRVIIGDSH